MRTACLQARIEQASPAVVRALNSAMYAFINELYNLALQPLQALGVAGLISFCSALPWIGTLRTILPTLSSLSGLCGRTGLSTHGSFKLEDIEDNSNQRVVVLHNGSRTMLGDSNQRTHKRLSQLSTPFCD